MPEISLKEYFAKLNSRLAANAADEVIHHCRHILQSYPKNVTAYRLLGRALVLNGRWDEGREALRRVLSVIPDDYAAHLSLSEANERMDRSDEAIWHLERALEQRPNDKDLIEALRGLYRRYRHVENLKIQLTAVAVARQNLRGGNYSQAIDTLRNALTRMNDRLDLKLLLAQILWQNGSEEEAAEIALEVLKVLPDCLEANRIMAKLWLSVDRPSDAQRYVNHLEAVDPYLAVELVQGSAPDDDAFRIDELDYVRSAQSEVASERPDWLREISTTPTSTAEVAKVSSDDDWSSAMLKKPPTAPLKEIPPPAGQSMSARFAAMKQEEPVSREGMTDVFGKQDEADANELSSIFAGDHSEEEDPMAWLHEAGVQIVDDAPEEQPQSYNNLFGDDEDGPLPEEENPLAWLQGADVTIDDDEPSSTDADTDDSPSWLYGETPAEFADTQQPATANDSLDWLQGDNLLDEALGMDSLNADPSGSTIVQMRSPTVSDRADQLFDPPTNEPPAPAPRRGLTAMLQETNFDWTNKQEENVSTDDEMDDWLNQFGPAEPRKAVNETPDWLTDLEKPDEAAPDSDEWFASDETALKTEQPVAASEELAWMSNDDSDNLIDAEPGDEDSDWLAEFKPGDEEAEQPAEDDEFTWMATDSSEEAAASEVPDWLSELNPEANAEALPAAEEATGSSALKWLNSDSLTNDNSEAEPEAEAETPDWLSALEPTQTDDQASAVAEAPVLDTEFSWLSDEALGTLDSIPAADSEVEPETEAVASEEIDWLSELEPEADSNTATPMEAEADTEVVPDWLSELEPEGLSSEPNSIATESASADTDFAWLADEENIETQLESEAAVDEAPDWLSELAPEGAIAATTESATSNVSDDSEFTWMSDEALATPEASAEEEVVAEDVPDWLSELAPEPSSTEPEPAAEPAVAQDSEFTWMMEQALANAGGEDKPESESESEVVAGDVPDWLSELAPEPTSSEPEPAAEAGGVNDSEFTWMTDEALASAENASATVDPEFTWMVTEPDADEAETEAVAGDGDWLNELEPDGNEAEAEPEAVGAGDLDWLSELEPTDETSSSEPEAEPEPAAADGMNWLSELEPDQEETEAEAELEAVAADADVDWLSELEPEEDAEPEPEAVAADADVDWLSELEPEEDAEAEPQAVAADADIDWLSELQPEEDESEFEPEAMATGVSGEDAATDDDFAWLDERNTEDSPEEGQTSTSIPQPEPDAVSEDASVDAEEEIGENEAEYAPAAMVEGEPHEATPAHNAPDWLNAMVPGLDVDYEAAEDEVAEEEPEPEAEAETSKREYAWLIEMVEEENAATVSTDGTRFTFSRPPSWMQATNGLNHAQGDEVDDDLPDWPSDDTDADVPEWLR